MFVWIGGDAIGGAHSNMRRTSDPEYLYRARVQRVTIRQSGAAR